MAQLLTFTEHEMCIDEKGRPYLQPTHTKKFADGDFGTSLRCIAEVIYPREGATQSDIQEGLDKLLGMLNKIKRRIDLIDEDMATNHMFVMASQSLLQHFMVYLRASRRNPHGDAINYLMSVEMHQPLPKWLGDRDFFYALYDEGVLQFIIDFMEEAVLANVKDYNELKGFDLVSAFVDSAVKSAEEMALNLMLQKQAIEEAARQEAEEAAQTIGSFKLLGLLRNAKSRRACKLWRDKVTEAKAEKAEDAKKTHHFKWMANDPNRVVYFIIKLAIIIFMSVLLYNSRHLISALYYLVCGYAPNIKPKAEESFSLEGVCSPNNQGVQCKYSWERIGRLYHLAFTPTVVKYDAQRGDNPDADHIKGDISTEKAGDFKIPIDWKTGPDTVTIYMTLYGNDGYGSPWSLSTSIKETVQYNYEEMNLSEQTMQGDVDKLANQNAEMNGLKSNAKEMLEVANTAKEVISKMTEGAAVTSVYDNDMKPASEESTRILNRAKTINATIETKRALIEKQVWTNEQLLGQAKLALKELLSSFEEVEKCAKQVQQVYLDVFQDCLRKSKYKPQEKKDGGNPGNPNPDGTPRFNSIIPVFDDFGKFIENLAQVFQKAHVHMSSFVNKR